MQKLLKTLRAESVSEECLLLVRFKSVVSGRLLIAAAYGQIVRRLNVIQQDRAISYDGADDMIAAVRDCLQQSSESTSFKHTR